MKVLILEDELPAARRLAKLLKDSDDQIEILDTIQSVKAGIEWFANNPLPDLVFSDIQLSDDLCFEVFKTLNSTIPIVFTTAYDEYAIKAFEFYSIDYLLKPVKLDLLCRALEKFRNVSPAVNVPYPDFNEIAERITGKVYKNRFLVYVGDALVPIVIDNVAYLSSENGTTYLITKNGDKYVIQDSLDNLEKELDPKYFFRANRHVIISLNSIIKINQHFNQKLKLEVYPRYDKDLYVSKLKATTFKKWLNG